jgi:hypothetical protein
MASSIDLLLGVTLIIGVGVQSIYVPHTQGGCSMADKWQVDDNGMSLFTFLGDIRQVSAASICSEFFTIWVLGILVGSVSRIWNLGTPFLLTPAQAFISMRFLCKLCQVFTAKDQITAPLPPPVRLPSRNRRQLLCPPSHHPHQHPHYLRHAILSKVEN